MNPRAQSRLRREAEEQARYYSRPPIGPHQFAASFVRDEQCMYCDFKREDEIHEQHQPIDAI